MLEENPPILSDISNSPQSTITLKAFERAPSRNPFAIKKPLFDDKEAECSQQMTKLNEKVTSTLHNDKSPKTVERSSSTPITSPTNSALSSSNFSRHSSLFMNKSVRPSGEYMLNSRFFSGRMSVCLVVYHRSFTKRLGQLGQNLNEMCFHLVCGWSQLKRISIRFQNTDKRGFCKF